MKYTPSIVYDLDRCACCGSRNDLQIHHIFGGRNRTKSTEYGLTVALCRRHHTEAPTGVHGGNKELDEELKACGQKAYMELFGASTEDFIKVFGKSYI